MAPAVDNPVESLKGVIDKLEKRIEDLEARLRQASGEKPQAQPGQIRLVIMGPPGAGKILKLPPLCFGVF